jgi:phage shock protein A
MATKTTKTTTKTATKATTTNNSKEIKSLNEKIVTLENKIKNLENLCTELSATKSAARATDEEVLTRKDWNRLKQLLASVKMPARAAELM